MSQFSRSKIRVLVVDNSAFMRRAISSMLATDEAIEVVGTVGTWELAAKKVQEMSPDVITMDIAMPIMDGCATLKRILSDYMTSVIIIASLKEAESASKVQSFVLEALDVLAAETMDVLVKPEAIDKIHEMRDELIGRVRAMSRRAPRQAGMRSREVPIGPMGRAPGPAAAVAPPLPAPRPVSPPAASSSVSPLRGAGAVSVGDGDGVRISGKRFQLKQVDLVCIGSSTGGPTIVEQIVRGLPRSLSVPVVVAQHMPFMFTKSMAERFDSIAEVAVRHAADRMPIEPGSVYIAPGGLHLQVVRRGGQLQASVGDTPEGYIYKPSVDVLFESAAGLAGVRTLGVVLTGMGSDGVVGARSLAAAGGTLIAQDKESCVVYGMPRAIVDAGLAAASLPPAGLLSAIVQACGATQRAAAG